MVLAVVGLAGVGKSSVTQLLVDCHRMAPVYFGGAVLEAIQAAGLSVTPNTEREMREQLRADGGPGILAQRLLPSIHEHLALGHPVVVDGLYSPAEYTVLADTFGSSLATVAVHAPRRLRIERLAARHVRPLSAPEVDERDRHEIETLGKAVPIVLADYHIVNDRSRSDLATDVTNVLQSILEST